MYIEPCTQGADNMSFCAYLKKIIPKKKTDVLKQADAILKKKRLNWLEAVIHEGVREAFKKSRPGVFSPK